MGELTGVGGPFGGGAMDALQAQEGLREVAPPAAEPVAPEPEAEPVAVQAGAMASARFSAGMLEGLVNAKLDETGTTQTDALAAQDVAMIQPDLQDPREVREKMERLLDGTGQIDNDASTKTDSIRCQSNVAVAALLLSGGPKALAGGLARAKEAAEKQIAAAEQKTPKDAATIKRLKQAVKVFDRTMEKIDVGEPLTQSDIDQTSDALFKTFSPSSYAKGSLDSTGMVKEEITRMEKTLGLTSKDHPEEVGESDATIDLRDDEREVSDNVWGKIGPGESAHVGVSGKPGKDTVINHAVLFGRDEDGNRYIYDPLNKPHMRKEDIHDPDSVKRFDQASENLMGKKDGDYYARVTKFDKA